MNVYSTLCYLGFCIAAFVLPRRLLPALIYATASLTTMAIVASIGDVSFPLIRAVIICATVRVLATANWSESPLTRLDKTMLFFAVWVLVARIVAPKSDLSLVAVVGYMINFIGTYFVVRLSIKTIEEFYGFIKAAIFISALAGGVMVIEVLQRVNVIALLEGQPADVMLRKDQVRARGAFQHAINGGMLGVSTALLSLAFGPRDKLFKIIGFIVGFSVVLLSRSSTPAVALLLGIGCLFTWKFREKRRHLPKLLLGGYLFIEIFANYPAYFVISRIDLTGGSTGWHRAELIRVAIAHFRDWALFGTDYTKHWMRSEVSWSPNHIDITNYFIYWGVIAGFPAVLIMCLLIWRSFRATSYVIGAVHEQSTPIAWAGWATACLLASIVFSSLSMTFYDQSFVYFWIPFGLVVAVSEVARREDDSTKSYHDHRGNNLENAPA